jgi:hypothetical protein
MGKNKLYQFVSAALVALMAFTIVPQSKVYAAETQFFSHSDFTTEELKQYQGPASVNAENKYGNDTPKLSIAKGTVTKEFDPITSGKVYLSGIFAYDSGSAWIRIKNSADVTLINVEGAKSGNINLDGISNTTTGGPLGGGVATSNQGFKKANVGAKTWQMIALETDLDQKTDGLKFKMTVYVTSNYKGADTDWGIPAVVKDIPVADTNATTHTNVFDIAKLELVSTAKAFYLDDLILSNQAPKLPDYTIPVAENAFFSHSDFTEADLKEYQGDKAVHTEDKYGNATPKLVVKSGTVSREFKPVTSGKVYLSSIFLYQSGSQWIRVKNSENVPLINVECAKSGNINLNGVDNITTGGPLNGGDSASNQALKKANVGTKTWQMIALETDLDQKTSGLKFKMTVYVTDNYKGADTDWGIPVVVTDIPVADTNAKTHTNVLDIAKIELVSDDANAFYIDDLKLSDQAPKLPEYTLPKTEEEKNLEKDVLEIENYLVEYINNPLVTFTDNVLKVNKRTLSFPSKGKYKTAVTWSVETPSPYITINNNLVTLSPSTEEAKSVNIVANFSASNEETKQTFAATKVITVAIPKASSSGSGASMDLSTPQALQNAIKNMKDNGAFKNIETLPNNLNSNIKTEEFITMLLNVFDVDTQYTQVTIDKADMDYNAAYADYIIAAFQLSIEKHPGEKNYGIGETITKDELYAMIKRMVAIDQSKISDELINQILK